LPSIAAPITLAPMEIRALTASDAAAFWALRLRGFREEPDSFSTSFEEASRLPAGHAASLLAREGRSPDDFVLGAFRDGALVGIVGFARELRMRRSHRGVVWGMHVAREARGAGVGRALIAALVERARALPGLCRLNLTVMAANEGAVRLYQRAGFEVWGRETAAMVHDGRRHDEYSMALALDDRQATA
jgi:RimJ/RimL family protein N-acetyltransferase